MTGRVFPVCSGTKKPCTLGAVRALGIVGYSLADLVAVDEAVAVFAVEGLAEAGDLSLLVDAEEHAFGEGAGDEGGGDDGELALEHGKDVLGDAVDDAFVNAA